MTDPIPSLRLPHAARLALTWIVLGLGACAQAPLVTAPPAKTPTIDSARYQAMVVDARALIDRKRPDEAIEKDLDPVIDAYDRAYGTSAIAYYSVRTMPETILYLTMSPISPGTGRPDVPGGPSAIALDQTWSAALYLKGYALIELHRYGAAREALEHAVRLAPSNSQYLSELGQLSLMEKNWSKALGLFARAEQAAEVSPPQSKTSELGHALCGSAYADVELGKFDDAVALYERCLAIDPGDTKAAAELRYVRAQQTSRISRPQ